MLRSVLALLLSVILLSSCGGGGGGGSSSGEATGTLSRNTRTAIRILHGAIDTTPVTVNVGGKDVQSSAYSQSKFYQGVSQGELGVSVFRQNDPSTTFAQFNSTFEKDTEYSLFVVNKNGGDGLNIKVLTDQVNRPEAGKGFLRVVNAYASRNLSVATAAASLADVSFGSASNFVEVLSGPITVDFLNSSGGKVAGGTFEVPDQGELTLMVSGSENIGFATVQEYKDLD